MYGEHGLPVAQGARVDGIIPACTGSTISTTQRTLLQRDHPRMYGEHLGFFPFAVVTMGSSPHVRGAPY